ncbi:hypothetical protein EJB05_07297, partial [Eragrostis curvula]
MEHRFKGTEKLIDPSNRDVLFDSDLIMSLRHRDLDEKHRSRDGWSLEGLHMDSDGIEVSGCVKTTEVGSSVNDTDNRSVCANGPISCKSRGKPRLPWQVS